jgi:hypothetical protein
MSSFMVYKLDNLNRTHTQIRCQDDAKTRTFCLHMKADEPMDFHGRELLAERALGGTLETHEANSQTPSENKADN